MSTSPDTQDMAADDVIATETVTTDGRQRGPATYDVYRQTAEATWQEIGVDVVATNRRGAVIAAVKDPTSDEAFGQFLVVRSNEAKVLTREKKVIPETIADDWK